MDNILSYSQIYRILLAEAECAKKRSFCNKDCSKCDLYIKSTKLQSAYRQLIEIIKAKDPMLYFCSDVEELKALLDKGGNK